MSLHLSNRPIYTSPYEGYTLVRPLDLEILKLLGIDFSCYYLIATVGTSSHLGPPSLHKMKMCKLGIS